MGDKKKTITYISNVNVVNLHGIHSLAFANPTFR